MKSILTVLFSFVFLVSGFSQTRNVVVGTNDVIVQPTNFWSANASNGRTGLGLGSAATNPASAFQPSSSVLSNLASSNGASLTNISVSNVVGALKTNGNGFGLTNLNASNITGIIPASNISTVNLTNIGGTLAIASGGTGATNSAGARTNLGLGETNNVIFNNIQFASGSMTGGGFSIDTNNATFVSVGVRINNTNGLVFWGVNSNAARNATRTNLGLGAAWLTNTDVTNFRTSIGLGLTNSVTFGNLTISNTINNTVATFSEPNGTVFEIIVADEGLQNGYGSANLAIGVGGEAGFQIKYGTNTTAWGRPVIVDGSGEVVSPTNFWQVAPIQTVVQNLAPITNSTNAAINARNLYVYSLATNITGVTNTVTLPTNTSTFAGDSATITHQGTTSSVTAVRQAGAGSNLITINRFDESIKFIYENNSWTTYHNISFQEPIYFSGTNAAANAAASRTNLGLGATNQVVFDVGSASNVGIGVGSSNTGLASGGELSGRLGLIRNGDIVAELSADTIIGMRLRAPITFHAPSASNNSAITRTNLGLGATNDVAFRSITVGQTALATNFALGFLITNTIPTTNTNAYGFAWASANSGRLSYVHENNTVFIVDDAEFRMSVPFSFTNQTTLAQTRTNLGLGLPALTNTSVTNFQKAVFYTNTAPSNIGGNLGTIAAWIEIVASNGVTYKVPAYTNVP